MKLDKVDEGSLETNFKYPKTIPTNFVHEKHSEHFLNDHKAKNIDVVW